MATVKDLMVKLKADTSDFDRGMDEASNSASNFSNKMGKVMDNVKSFLIYDIGKNLVTGFIDATKAGIGYNATLEESAIKWETLLGTQEKANKMLQDIQKFAKDTPFEQMGVEAMATQLHNAGFEGEALFNQISKFGDLAGAFGIQSESLQEMVRQYSQVKQAGVAYTEDLNILQDRGIPIYKALGEELGINTADVKKWASEGKISSEVYQKALDNLAKGVEGGMEKMSKSFNGQLSTMKDNFEQMAGILSKPIFDFLAEQLSKVMPFIEAVTSSLSENGLMGTIQKFAPQAMPFIQAIIGIFDNLKNAVKRILDAIMGFWNEHSSWLMPLISFTWDFICNFIGTTINAIASVIEAGLSLIDGIINFFQNLFSGNFKGCWESIKQIFSNAIKLIWNWMQVQFAVNLPNMIKNFGKSIPNIISNMWNSIKSFFSNGITNCIQFVKNLFTNASSNFGMLKTFGANTFEALWSIAKNAMSNLLKAVISNIKQVPTNVKNFMTQAVDVIKNINLFSIGKSMIQGLINGIKNMGSSVVGAIGGIVTNAIDSAKKKLGINSPSRVFRKIGEGTGQGLINGLENKEIDVKKASQRLSNGVISGYNANINTNFSKGLNGGNNANYTNGISLNIENFNNNTDKDIEYLANELAFYMNRKRIGVGGAF